MLNLRVTVSGNLKGTVNMAVISQRSDLLCAEKGGIDARVVPR